jgi:hypothetical protein
MESWGIGLDDINKALGERVCNHVLDAWNVDVTKGDLCLDEDAGGKLYKGGVVVPGTEGVECFNGVYGVRVDEQSCRRMRKCSSPEQQ